ncbi:MAG: HAD family hydrolase [Bdellovibrionales bacterium]
MKEAKVAALDGRAIRAVFDLDSTIFEVAPRSQQILKEFLETRPQYAQYEPYFDRLALVEVQPTDWGLRTAMERHGLMDLPEHLRRILIQFWRERFFSHSYLQLDHPYEGAVEFVQKLQQVGSKIYYLTGRDEFRMGQGTRDVLKKWDLPVEENGATLIMKERSGLDDAEFKTNALKKIDGTIWFFENEPANILPVLEQCPHVQVVFFDSTHSRQAVAPDHLPKIQHYILDDVLEEE